MGNPVEGTLRCDGPSWFIVAPGPMDAQIKYELQIPKGAAQHCTHLNARDGAGNVVDATVSLCSDDAAKFSAGQGPFGKDVAYFTIEPNDPDGPCVAARYRLTLLAK